MGRSPTKVVITADTVVDLAKSALVPIRCDALMPSKPGATGASTTTSCAQELNSWRLLLRHQYKKHSSKRKGAAFPYTCGLSRCSAHLHQSLDALKNHVEMSHMKNVSLPCPFTNCKPHVYDFGRPMQHNMFSKEKDLIAHLEQDHSELIGRELDLCSDLLLPSWEPRPPVRLLAPPPDLPFGKIPMAKLRLEGITPRRMRPGLFPRVDADGASSSSNRLAPPPLTRTPTPSLTLIPATPKTPSSRRPLLPTSSVISIASTERESEPQYDCVDLPVVNVDPHTGAMARYESEARNLLNFHLHPHHVNRVPIVDILAPSSIVVRKLDAEFDRAELARALPMPQAPMAELPPPPTPIFYEALRHQVFADYAKGEGAVSDSASSVPLG
ncbi:hypothetical protein MVEN_01223800 [Mycena venus]|uniref:C2H2-type domain-containing protein n=1 Tax=Mycena venus TaxID=2733690 RepID=A0A8H6Y3E8_9AGAR|nr:hypothetical protein MVEN_01223800 [Mycena venus]